MPVSIEQMLQKLQISGSPSPGSSSRTLPQSIKQLLQNIKISGPTSLRPSANTPQINTKCPPKQDVRQHYGYRVDERYMLFIEDLLRADPTFDHDAFYNPMTLALSWISEELRLYQLDFKYCHDPERRPIVPVYDALEDLEEFQEGGIDGEEEDEDEDLFVILVLSVFSDDPESFHARPTQPQLDLLTSLLGSQPQWWVGYKGWC